MYYGIYKYDPPHQDKQIYARNLLFLQESTGLFSYALQELKTWKHETVHWNSPTAAKQTLRYIEISFFPVLFYCYFFKITDLLLLVAFSSVLAAHPFIETILVLLLTRAKNLSEDLLIGLKLKRRQPVSSSSPVSSPNQKVFRIYENQRRWVGVWTQYTFPAERKNWSDVNGKSSNKEDIALPTDSQWEDQWKLEKSEHDGWEYAPDFTRHFHPHKETWDSVRRRCWVRIAKVNK